MKNHVLITGKLLMTGIILANLTHVAWAKSDLFALPFYAEDLKPGERWSTDNHAKTKTQKFGYDLGVKRYLGNNEWSHLVTGGVNSKNEDYLVYGKPVYAMADGMVIGCWRNAPENPAPRQRHVKKNWMPGGGNMLWIQHNAGERTLYAHFQPGTIPKELCPNENMFFSKEKNENEVFLPKGKQVPVTKGTFLGLVGNSGSSSAPHLHIHTEKVDNNGNGVAAIKMSYEKGLFTHHYNKTSDINKWSKFPNNKIPAGPVLIWPPRRVGEEYSRHGVPAGIFQRLFDHLNDSGYMPVWIDGYSVGGKTFYNMVWKPATVSWRAYFGLTSQSYQNKFDQSVNKGYRLMHVDSYLSNGKVRYAAIFRKENLAFRAYHGLSYNQHVSKMNSAVAAGYRPTVVSVVSVNGERRYTVLYHKKNIGSWRLKSRLSASQYQQAVNANKNAGRIQMYINAYMHKGRPYFSAIFASKPHGKWKARHGLTSSQYQHEFNSAMQQGLLTRVVSGYDGAKSNHRFVGVWRSGNKVSAVVGNLGSVPAGFVPANSKSYKLQSEFEDIELGGTSIPRTKAQADSPAHGRAFPGPVVLTARPQVINVTDFGATPDDDGDDDCFPIQAAINSAQGNLVFFPQGTYHIGCTINVPSNSHLYGQPGLSVIEVTSAELTAFQIVDVSNVKFRDLTIKLKGNGINLNRLLLRGTGIYLTEAENVTIENMRINDGWAGIILNDKADMLYKAVEANSELCGLPNPNRNIIIRKNRINGQRKAGIFILNVENSQFSYNHIGHTEFDGIKLGCGPVRNNRFVGNYLHHNKRDGLDGALAGATDPFQAAAFGGISRNIFKGNLLYDNGHFGLELKTNTSDVDRNNYSPCELPGHYSVGTNRIISNIIIRNRSSGISLQKTWPDGYQCKSSWPAPLKLQTRIVRNVIYGNSSPDANHQGGIFMNKSRYISITGNWVDGNEGDCEVCAINKTRQVSVKRNFVEDNRIDLWVEDDVNQFNPTWGQHIGPNQPPAQNILNNMVSNIFSTYPYHMQDNDNDFIPNGEEVLLGTDPNIPN